ncbi:hypothetical protein GCM10010129_35200 [Streptomyces fumigatiscleroticus]|nr:hypothetical protein GCM10010129_35200 [Streptomyces fumigatiscleroticus]
MKVEEGCHIVAGYVPTAFSGERRGGVRKSQPAGETRQIREGEMLSGRVDPLVATPEWAFGDQALSAFELDFLGSGERLRLPLGRAWGTHALSGLP